MGSDRSPEDGHTLLAHPLNVLQMSHASCKCVTFSHMPADPKVPVNFRTAASGREWLDEVAGQHRVDRSDVIRAALALARMQQKELSAMIEARR